MPADLKLYTFLEDVTFNQINLARLQSSSLTDPGVSGLELITNKVVKFLLTERGSDVFDPTYGSEWIKMSQVAESYLSRLRVEVDRDIWKCMEFIFNIERPMSSSIEKLRNIEFLGFTKDTSTGVPIILLKIRIYTSFGNVATFNIGR